MYFMRYVPPRLHALYQVLRGRPLIYRGQIRELILSPGAKHHLILEAVVGK